MLGFEYNRSGTSRVGDKRTYNHAIRNKVNTKRKGGGGQ